MNYRDAYKELKDIIAFMDGKVEGIAEISETLQERIYNLIVREIQLFDVVNGRLTAGVDFRKRILLIEQRISEIVGQKNFSNEIDKLLNSFESVERRNITFQSIFNDIGVKPMDVKPDRLLTYERAKDALSANTGINVAYVQPIKYLIATQVTSNAGINDALKIIEAWNKGEMVKGKFTNDGTPTPNLQKYATQVARDSIYGVHRGFNNIVKAKYGLGNIIYAGGLVKDSRPLCEYLVSLRRPIALEEIGELFKGKIPPAAMAFAEKPTKEGFLQGTVPGTNADNFCEYAGGINCQHQAIAVR